MTPGDGCCCIGGHNDRLSAYCLWLAVKCPAVGEMGEIWERRGESGQGWSAGGQSRSGVSSNDVENSFISTTVFVSEVATVGSVFFFLNAH